VAAVFWSLTLVGLVDVADPQVKRDKAGGVSQAQADSVFDLKAGDCFLVRDRTEGGGIRWVLLVPCSQHHDGQIYATPMLPKDTLDPEAATRAACERALPAGPEASAPTSFLYPTDTVEITEGRARSSCFFGS
jgi:hypothetical protein